MVRPGAGQLLDSYSVRGSRDTLNPKLSGNSMKSFLRRVLFPEPDGPATTRGRGGGALGCLDAMSGQRINEAAEAIIDFQALMMT